MKTHKIVIHLLLLVKLSLFMLLPELARAVAPVATVALTAAQKKLISYKCEVSRYSGDADVNPIKFVDYYPHCYRMQYRNPGQNYSFYTDSSKTKVVTVTASDFAKADSDTLSLLATKENGVVESHSYKYFQREHLWCLDPNPPLQADGATPVATCRPFAFTLCSDSNDVDKSAELAGLPSHLCNSAVYNRRWRDMYGPDVPPP